MDSMCRSVTVCSASSGGLHFEHTALGKEGPEQAQELGALLERFQKSQLGRQRCAHPILPLITRLRRG